MSTRASVQAKQQHVANLATRGMRTQGAKTGVGLGTDLRSLQRTAGNSSVNNLISSLGGGAPLPMELRGEMEQRFGEDFRKVRMHTDTRAARSADELNAKAYTLGNNIVFNEGRFTPETTEGKRLLAHELTHVVQQNARGALGIQRQTNEEEKKKSAVETLPKVAPETKPAAVAAPSATTLSLASSAEVDALDLAATAKAAAQELKKKRPEISFTSGRRDVAEQAHAMASNIVNGKDREWIEKTYASAAPLQKWVNDNPKATTVDDIAKGLEETMNGMPESKLGQVSKHLSGEAFDVQPQDKDADAIKKDIKALSGLTKFLDQEGGLVRWHAQFKKADNVTSGDDPYEREADRMAEQVVNPTGSISSAHLHTSQQSRLAGLGAPVLQRADAGARDGGVTSGAGPKVTRTFALTFDDGPHVAPLGTGKNRTEKVLNTLRNKGIKAGFFIQTAALDAKENQMRGGAPVGKKLVKRMIEEGHKVGIHTGGKVDHELHTKAGAAGRLEGELEAAKSYIKTQTGTETDLVRPPEGISGKSVESIYNKVNLKNLLWDIDGDKGKNLSLEDLKRRFESELSTVQKMGWKPKTSSPHTVILYHDIQEGTADNLPTLIDHIKTTTLEMSDGKDQADFKAP